MTGAPPPLDLPSGHARHDPSVAEQREAVLGLAQVPATTLADWPAYVEHLLAVGRTDVPLAKLVEGHLDALRIHAEAGTTPQPGAYAVWASRSRRTGLAARRDGEVWVLDGELAFTSGGGVVDRALVPVWPDDETHVLLDLDVSGWEFDTSGWVAQGMRGSRTGRVRLERARVVADQVGPDCFYLDRPGFFPGGVGVAAVWAGGAARVADLLERAAPPDRRSPAKARRLGVVRTEVAAAVACCRSDLAGDARTASTLVRAAVAAGVRRVLAEARVLAGAVGLALDEDLLRAIADLELYVAQQPPDADAEWLGST